MAHVAVNVTVNFVLHGTIEQSYFKHSPLFDVTVFTKIINFGADKGMQEGV